MDEVEIQMESRIQLENNNRGISVVVTAVAACIVAIHGYAAFYPTGLNWGFHHLGYLSPVIAGVVILLMSLSLLPRVQTLILSIFEKADLFVDRMPSRTLKQYSIAGLLCLMFLFWIGRERLPFLGDGFLVERALSLLQAASEIPQTDYANEPLSALVFYSSFYAVHTIGIDVTPRQTYHGVSILLGVLSVVLMAMLARHLVKKGPEAALAFALLLLCGGSQLFFGYVEDYAPFYCGLLFFVLTTTLYLEDERSVIYVGISYAVLCLLHFGAIVFLPCVLLVLFIEVHQKKAFSALLTFGLMSAIIAAGLFITGYSAEGLVTQFKGASGASFLGGEPTSKAYDFFTWYHLTDILNLLTLISPLAFPLAGILSVGYFGRSFVTDKKLLFLILATLCGLAFIVGVNSLLGMSRDWDLFATFALPLSIFTIYAWNRYVADQSVRRRFMVVLVIITGLHTSAWVAVNAKAETSFRRFVQLGDKHVWSTKALSNAYDEVGAWYNAHDNYVEALRYYLKFYSLDTHNPRLLVNIGVQYMNLRDTANAMSFFRRAADNGSADERVYATVGQYCADRNLPDDALTYFDRGLELNPSSATMANEAGLVLFRDKEDVEGALGYFLRSIGSDSTFAEAYSNAALCCFALHDTVDMNRYVDKYLQLRPEDTAILRLKEDARQMLRDERKKPK